jgi:hypothetical protein
VLTEGFLFPALAIIFTDRIEHHMRAQVFVLKKTGDPVPRITIFKRKIVLLAVVRSRHGRRFGLVSRTLETTLN